MGSAVIYGGAKVGTPGPNCLFTLLSQQGMSPVDVYPLWLSPSYSKLEVSQLIPYCSDAETSIVCRADYSQSFTKEEGEKKNRKMCGRTVFGYFPGH